MQTQLGANENGPVVATAVSSPRKALPYRVALLWLLCLVMVGGWQAATAVVASGVPLFGQSFLADGDAGQCGGMGVGFANFGDWTDPIRVETNNRAGGCWQSFAIVDPNKVLTGLRLFVIFGANGNPAQCNNVGPKPVPISSTGPVFSDPYRIDTDDSPGGCQQFFVLEGRDDIALDIDFEPDGDPLNCGNRGLHTVVEGQPVQLLLDTGSSRPGGCLQRFRLRKRS